MNAELLRQGGIDYDFCVRRFVGRAALFEKALGKFARDGTFARIRAAFEADDRAALLASAHEFKGMCGNIGLTALFEASDALVRLLRGGAVSAGELGAAYERLRAGYETTHAAVAAAMEETL